MLERDINGIFSAFEEEMNRKPTLLEFFSLLLWPINNVDSVKIKIPGKILIINSHEIMNFVGELNDNCFVLSSELTSKHLLNIDEQAGPIEAKKFFDLILNALRKSNEIAFSDIHQLNVGKIDTFSLNRKNKSPKAGDVVSIPLSEDHFAVAIMIAKTSFGIAFGVFNKRYNKLLIKRFKNDPVLRFQLFTENSGFKNARWKILFNDESLLSLFPKEPEKFHDPTSFDMAKPYGLGETSAGELRKLSEKEAQEIGILEKGFQQVLLSGEIEDYLNRVLV